MFEVVVVFLWIDVIGRYRSTDHMRILYFLLSLPSCTLSFYEIQSSKSVPFWRAFSTPIEIHQEKKKNVGAAMIDGMFYNASEQNHQQRSLSFLPFMV